MNLSGTSVAALVQVELDPKRDLIGPSRRAGLPLGELRLKERGSANGITGVEIYLRHARTEEWFRIRHRRRETGAGRWYRGKGWRQGLSSAADAIGKSWPCSMKFSTVSVLQSKQRSATGSPQR